MPGDAFGGGTDVQEQRGIVRNQVRGTGGDVGFFRGHQHLARTVAQVFDVIHDQRATVHALYQLTLV